MRVSRKCKAGMAGVLFESVNRCCSPRGLLLLFYMLCFVRVVEKEWKLTMAHTASPTVVHDVLHLSRSTRLKSSDQSTFAHQRFVRDVATAKNVTGTGYAKVFHRNALPSLRNETRLERMRDTIRRDEARVRVINHRAAAKKHAGLQAQQNTPFTSPLASGLKFGTGEYFAVLGVGTPRRDVSLAVDTGSDITWLQCAPCTSCYKQKDALFDPASSASYHALRCDAASCLDLDVMGCIANKCLYQADYGDGSFTSGDLATETVVLAAATGFSGEVIVADIPMGCGHDNEGLFGMAAGILGLGLGPLSFPNHVDGGVFSYCLPDRESDRHSSLIFGDAAIPDFPPSAVKFTPQLRNPRVATYYYIQITGISVGGNEVTSIPASAFKLDVQGNGGTIVDSGTTITRLQTAAYRAFRDAFRDGTQHLPAADEFAFFDTCYDLTGKESISVPTVTFHFQGGYDMRLPPANYIVPVNNNDTYCFAFAATAGPSIVGNVQQQGFQVIFDNLRMQIGFYPNQC